MSKPRSPGQTLIAVALDEQLLDAIDQRRGLINRSAFIRTVLAEYLKISLSLAAAPDRTRKGGRPKKAPLKALPTSAAQVKNQTKQTKPKAG